MSIRPSYTRFYASKWRSGTLMLSLEEEGLYIRISAFQMECGQPLPQDWKEGARLLCVQPLKYRKTIDALLAKGLVVSTPEGIVCERAILEFKRASKSVEGDKSDPPTYPHTNPDTYPVTNPASMGVEAENDEQKQDQNHKRREEEEKTEIITSVAPRTAALPSDGDLSDRLIKACNGALDNPVNCMGLLSVATPVMWLKQGCDLELDVIPTLTAAGKKHHGKRIRSWSYFTPMVAEAKANREAGLPAVGSAKPAEKPPIDAEAAEAKVRDMKRRIEAVKLAALGGAHVQ